MIKSTPTLSSPSSSYNVKITFPLISLLFSIVLLSCYYCSSSGNGSTALRTTLFAATGLALASVCLIMVARTTMVTWITVLVLLACLGKRRRFLANEGKKITADVALNVMKIMIKEKGFCTVVCATAVSLIAMAQAIRV